MRYVFRLLITIALPLAMLATSACKPSLITAGLSAATNMAGASTPDGVIVTSINASPADGPIAAGTVVTLTGSGFTSDLQVSINGVSCTPVVVPSSTILTCTATATIPAGGPVIVVTKSGSTSGSSGSGSGSASGSGSGSGATSPAPAPAPPPNLAPTFSGLRCPKAVEGKAVAPAECRFDSLADDGGVNNLSISVNPASTCTFISAAAISGTYKASLTTSVPAGGSGGTSCTLSLNIMDGANTVTASSTITVGNAITINASGNITNAATISNNSIVIPTGNNVTFAFSNPITLAGLDVQGTSKLTHRGCTTTACTPLDLTIDGNATIGASAKIDASGQGYLAGNTTGPDAVANSGVIARTYPNVQNGASSYAIGGSHAGLGGTSGAYSGVPKTYGNLYRPDTPGGGGGGYSGSPGGNGGGVVHLNVLGTLQLDGKLYALGANSADFGGGAGGSIWVETATLATTGGAAEINARGVSGGFGNTDRAPGGGGRIAVYYDTLNTIQLTFPTVINARGGDRPSGQAQGGSGTIFTKLRGESNGRLLLAADTSLPAPQYEQAYDASGFVSAVSATVLTTGNSLSLPPNAFAGLLLRPNLESSATATITGNSMNMITVTGADLSTMTSASKLYGIDGYGDTFDQLTILGNVRASFHRVAAQNSGSTGSIVVTGTGATLYTPLSNSGAVSAVDVAANLITITAGAAISANGRGYLGANLAGPNGASTSATTGETLGGTSTGGAIGGTMGGSHAGRGGRGGGGNWPPVVYGHITQPSNAGGGGGSFTGGYGSNAGGGVLKVTANYIDLAGTLSADGSYPPFQSTSSDGGGGAGGSLWVNVLTLASSGGAPKLTANGGPAGTGNTDRGAGGGGRLALYYSQLSGITLSNAIVQAFGGSATGAGHGGPGTVYLKASSDPKGHLWIDNNGTVSTHEATYDASGYVSNVTTNTISTSSMSLPPNNGLAGLLLIPNQESNVTATITGNSYQSITVTGADLTQLSVVGAAFAVQGYGDEFDSVKIDGKARVVAHRYKTRLPGGNGSLTITSSNATSPTALYSQFATTTGYSRLLIDSDNLSIGSNAQLSVTGRGYLGGTSYGGDLVQNSTGGYGRTLSNTLAGGSFGGPAGGSHGGVGGSTNLTANPPGTTYGNLYDPNHPGAGGGTYNGSYFGGNGGGVLRIVANTVTLNGSIDASGYYGRNVDLGINCDAGGGAGGSLYMNVATLSSSGGSPLIAANGFLGGAGGADRGAGGGGRVALYYSGLNGFTLDSSTVQAFGGVRASGSGHGGGGTVYTKTPSETYGRVTVANNAVKASTKTTFGITGINAAVTATTVTANTISLPPGALVGKLLRPNVEAATTVSITGNSTNMITVSGADLTTLTSVGKYMAVQGFGDQFDELVFRGGVSVQTQRIYAHNVAGNSSLVVTNGGATTNVYAMPASYYGFSPLELAADNLTIAASADVNATGLGYLGAFQTGADGTLNNTMTGATNGNTYAGGSYNLGGGGSHGGRGGSASGNAVAAAYDSLTQPTLPGSGGGGLSTSYKGRNGGGVIKIDVASNFLVDGIVEADGDISGWDSGGGGGGTVVLNTVTLSTAGAGIIRANGGAGGTGGGGRSDGGGGRVALSYTTLSGFAIGAASVQARGGAAGTAADGAAGTIYYKATADTQGSVLIDNTGVTPASVTYWTDLPLGANTSFKDLKCSNNGRLYVTHGGFTLTSTNSTTTTSATGYLDVTPGLSTLAGPDTYTNSH